MTARVFSVTATIFGVGAMKKQLSEEQLDQLMSRLITAAAADETTIAEISDSPATWWGVQRRINGQKETTLSAWPPVGRILRWLMIGAPAVAAILLAISFFISRPAEIAQTDTVAIMPTANRTDEKTFEPLNAPDEKSTVSSQLVQNSAKRVRHSSFTAKAQRKVTGSTTNAALRPNKKEEIKTDFIALSYARDPESGQIVRVKVPSSMMVSLGLVASVKKPSDLVDAEVLVGDDGLSRAIRFIR